MTKYIPIILVFLSVLFCKELLAAEDFYPTAIVNDEKAIFSIPIHHQNHYKWFDDSHKDNFAEYFCLIHLEDYYFGFKLYNFSFKKERSGNISKLLKDGQTDLWIKKGYTGSRVDNDSILVSYSLPIPFIKITINDPKTIKLLFSSKPEECEFTVYGFDAPFDKEYLEIEYEN